MTSNSISAPGWLNNSFFEEALRSGEDDSTITVIASEVKPAIAAGDNYGSDMYRATLEIKRGDKIEKKSIIVKAAKPLSGGEMAKIFKEINIFNQEIDVFTIFFPAVQSLLKEIPRWTFQPFAAQYIYSHSDETTSSIVMEDLKTKSFRLPEKKQGLDMKHCLLVMRKIAQFHAVSLVIHKRDPDMFKPFMKNAFSDDRKLGIEPLFIGGVKNFAKAIKTWPHYGERFADRIHNISDTVMEDWRRGFSRNDDDFNVLTHGDLWLSNMMFKYSDETDEVEEVRFIDFQLSHWTSPAVDLQYFINSSASPDVIENIDVLTDEYYNTLCESLAILGHQELQPSILQIHELLEKKGRFGVLASIVIRSVIFVDRKHVPDFNNLVSSKEAVQYSEAYTEAIKRMLPLYEKKGWL